ncbi:hypothetical protein [Devosia sp. A16]|uniref:hypothetical protein n=1 Tax=Devosia sp. A16 TaxID=1736675 RepID=UPI0006D77571|nr:hypothetical protein [Devosia sp. A16]
MRLAASIRSGRRQQLRLGTLPRIGGMASIPTRAGDLGQVLDSIVPQVERLYLFLHGYDAIPAVAHHSRVVPVLAPAASAFRASGKFYGLLQQAGPCLYFCFDDDILYPPDYVARMTAAILRYGGQAFVGVHGTDYPGPGESYARDRKSRHFARRLRLDRVIDELGCGTVAFPSELLNIDPRRWPHGDMDDLMLAIEAERSGISRIAIRRRRRWLVPLHQHQPDSLWVRTLADDSRQSAELVELKALMGRMPRHQPPARPIEAPAR